MRPPQGRAALQSAVSALCRAWFSALHIAAGAAGAISCCVAAGAAAATPAAPPATDGAVGAEGASPAAAFAKAFPTRQVPDREHLEARFRGADGQWHHLSIWRDGQVFLHRRTDDRMDLFVTAAPLAEGGLRYQVLDHRSRALIDVYRVNLARIGVFADWWTLAHVLSPSAVGERVARSPLALQAGALGNTRFDCHWWRLQPQAAGAAPTDVCWSSDWGVPVAIRRVDPAGAAADAARGMPTDATAADQFELLLAETADPNDAALKLPPLASDYSYVNANADIDPAGD
jgi:hypothetical protein